MDIYIYTYTYIHIYIYTYIYNIYIYIHISHRYSHHEFPYVSPYIPFKQQVPKQTSDFSQVSLDGFDDQQLRQQRHPLQQPCESHPLARPGGCWAIRLMKKRRFEQWEINDF